MHTHAKFRGDARQAGRRFSRARVYCAGIAKIRDCLQSTKAFAYDVLAVSLDLFFVCLFNCLFPNKSCGISQLSDTLFPGL